MVYSINTGTAFSGWEISESGLIYIVHTPEQIDRAIRALSTAEHESRYAAMALKEFREIRQHINNAVCIQAMRDAIIH